jgi:hypothetical protein
MNQIDETGQTNQIDQMNQTNSMNQTDQTDQINQIDQELINLQREGSKAKVYQVRQVRAVLLKYRLAGEGGED